LDLGFHPLAIPLSWPSFASAPYLPQYRPLLYLTDHLLLNHYYWKSDYWVLFDFVFLCLQDFVIAKVNHLGISQYL